jgi:phosphoglycolate phosphatase-like HAD superfamily hydrolase
MNYCENSLFAVDIDNCLLDNRLGWDKVFDELSRCLFRKKFIVTKKADGSTDTEFYRKTPIAIFRERMAESGINRPVSDDNFYRDIDTLGDLISYRELAKPYPGVRKFLRTIMERSGRRPCIVTHGTEFMQKKVLKDLELLPYFDFARSYFGARVSKKVVLDNLAYSQRTQTLAYVGGTPEDMVAITESVAPNLLAVGVTVSGLCTESELRGAGAHYVLNSFDEPALNAFVTFLLG